MLGRYQKKIALSKSKTNLSLFKKTYSSDFFASSGTEVQVHLVSMSGSKYFWDQLYTICSFYKNVGKPLSWTIYSDGTYTQEELKRFNSISFIRTINTTGSYHSFVDEHYVTQFPLLKKLDLYSKHTIEGTTFFCDSDVLFFSSFREYLPSLATDNWFLPDEANSYLDQDYIDRAGFAMYGVNSGFLVINKSTDWSAALDYIKERIKQNKPLGYWSEQTAIHIMSLKNKFMPLDPRGVCFVGQRQLQDFDIS